MSSVYDLLVLTVPQAATEGKDQPKTKIEALIGAQKGKVLTSEEWGERMLAYPIKKYDRGVYLLYTLELVADQVKQLTTKLSLENTVLRHLLVKRPSKATQITSEQK